MHNKKSIINDLTDLGVKQGDVILVHSSYKAIGDTSLSPDGIIECLLECIGDTGTLLMPALSHKQQPENLHDNSLTPSNVGVIPESFRANFQTIRSLHPTHSVCGIGKLAIELLEEHSVDRTPCGGHSPFHKLLFIDAKILMLGCGLLTNTTMHAIEEIIGTPYLFGDEQTYTLIDSLGNSEERIYRKHGFDGWEQRYDRIESYLQPHDYFVAKIGDAQSYLLNTKKLFLAATSALKKDHYTFVARKNT